MGWRGTKLFKSSDSYNYDDLNRVNENAEFILGQLLELGYNAELSQEIVTDYTMKSFPFVSSINQIRQNIKDLIASFPEALAIVQNVGPVIGTFYSGQDSLIFVETVVQEIIIDNSRKQVFDFHEANKLETSLQLLYDLISEKRAQFKVCGTFYVGEEGVIF